MAKYYKPEYDIPENYGNDSYSVIASEVEALKSDKKKYQFISIVLFMIAVYLFGSVSAINKMNHSRSYTADRDVSEIQYEAPQTVDTTELAQEAVVAEAQEAVVAESDIALDNKNEEEEEEEESQSVTQELVAPVNLSDVWVYEDRCYHSDLLHSPQDVYGNTYSTGIRYYAWRQEPEGNIIYQLNGNYHTFTGTIVGNSTWKTPFREDYPNCIFRIYTDNQCVETFEINRRITPTSLSVDLTGVQQLKIEFIFGELGYYCTDYADYLLADPQLT